MFFAAEPGSGHTGGGGAAGQVRPQRRRAEHLSANRAGQQDRRASAWVAASCRSALLSCFHVAILRFFYIVVKNSMCRVFNYLRAFCVQ